MSADSPRPTSGTRGIAVPAIVPPQVVSDRSVLDSAIGFINDVTLVHQPIPDPKDTITWARFETAADISDPRFGNDWEIEGNAAPPLLLILGYGLGVQVWAIPANGEAVEVLSWRHGVVSALRILPTPITAAALDDNGRAGDPVDLFAEKRPLIAFVDGGSGTVVTGGIMSTIAGPQQFCAVNFSSLKTGSQVKTIKFKNPVIDVQANRSAIIITFHERIAVFDARTLEDRLTITTCYPSPGINPNPVALGPRWLAYAENKLVHPKRSGGGCDGEGVSSYTATVLNAAKSLGKGLRELGEQMAAGLTGTTGSTGSSKNNSFDAATGSDAKQAGVVTIIDIKHPIRDYSPTTGIATNTHASMDPIVAHFIAHTEAIVAMEFDTSGVLLLTADRRGHDFHVFRVQPHPVGSSLSAVHHLYVLHRGDTSAKVQNIAFSQDSRWVAVSTLRGTTHVFPITPYGGAIGVRTHTSLHVVNKLSRFHRSAGLSADGRSSSPISHSESTMFIQSLQPYHNPTLAPFPRPAVVQPLAQLRQPFALGSPPGSASLAAVSGKLSGGVTVSGGVSVSTSQRQRLSSLSDDSGKPLSVCSIFAKSRSWLLDPPNATREASHRIQRKAVDSLFVMAGHGALIQYDLDTKLASNVAKEKICDDTPIELEVEAKAQWNLGRRKDGSQEIIPPLNLDNWLIKDRHACTLLDKAHHDDPDDHVESWLSQVEIITHAGPHRRLWMGPQFVFKNYNTPSGSNLNHVDAEAIEIGVSKNVSSTSAAGISGIMPITSSVGISGSNRSGRSSPLNMPITPTGRSGVSVLIESGSYSSIEQSPKLMDHFQHGHLDSDFGHGDTRLKEDLADAMRESPCITAAKRESGRLLLGSENAQSSAAHVTTAARIESLYYCCDAHKYHGDDGNVDVACSVDIGFDDLKENNDAAKHRRLDKAFKSNVAVSFASAAVLAAALPNICSYDQSTNVATKIEKIVNPLGTVTTISPGSSTVTKTDILDEVVSQLAAEDYVIHENCDEALFRPVFTIFCDDKTNKDGCNEANPKAEDCCKPPVAITNKLIVPVIAKEVDEVLTKKEKQQKILEKTMHQRHREQSNFKQIDQQQQQKFVELSTLSKRCNDTCRIADPIISVGVNKIQDPRSRKSTEKNKEEQENPPVKVKRDILDNQEKFIEENQKQRSCSEENQKKRNQAKNSENPCNKLGNIIPKEIFSHKEENTATEAKRITVAMKTSLEEMKPISFTTGNIKGANKRSKEAVIKKDVKEVRETTKQRKTPSKTSILDVNDLTDSLLDICIEDETSMAVVKLASPVEIYTNISPLTKSQEYSDDNKIYSSSGTQLKLRENNVNVVLDDAGDLANSVLEEKHKIVESIVNNTILTGLRPNVDTHREPTLEECKFKSLDTQYTQAMENLEKTDGNVKYVGKTMRNLSEETKDSRDAKNVSLKQSFPQKGNVMQKTKAELSAENITKKAMETDKKFEIDNEQLVVPKQTTAGKYINVNELGAKETSISREIRKSTAEQIKTSKTYVVKVIEEFLLPVEGRSDNGNEFLEISASKSGNPEKLALADLTKKQLTTQPKTEKFATLNNNQENWRDVKECERTEPETVPQIQIPSTSNAWRIRNSGEQPNNALEVTTSLVTTTSISEMDFPCLGKPTKKSEKDVSVSTELKSENFEDLMIGLRMPTKLSGKEPLQSTVFQEPLAISKFDKTSKNTANSMDFNDYLLLKPLESLPPLPTLEPLEINAKVKVNYNEGSRDALIPNQPSLINFESPQKENPALIRKIIQPPRGFNEKNLIFALCGSLHYENEFNTAERTEVIDNDMKMNSVSSRLPVTVTLKPCVAISISTSSSDNSSGSDEVIIMEEQQKSKKHKRQKQQLGRLQKQCVEHALQQDDDDELRPLISMSDSQLDNSYAENSTLAVTQMEAVSNAKLLTSKELSRLEFIKTNSSVNTASLLQSTSTTTDSEGALPATTSDDNLYLPSASIVHGTPNKLKTKKLDHKINLIAAIEAATSSSTSSAEESSIEIGRPVCSTMTSTAGENKISNPTDFVTTRENTATITINKSSPLPAAVTSSNCISLATPANTPIISNVQQNVQKKKTKRRKR